MSFRFTPEYFLQKFRDLDLEVTNENDEGEIKRKVNLIIKNKSYLDKKLETGKINPDMKHLDHGNFLNHEDIQNIKEIINEFDSKLEYLNQRLIFLKSEPSSNENNFKKAEESFNKQKTNNQEKIVWKKDKKDLAFLIDELIKLDFIAQHKSINKLISQHFTCEKSEIRPQEFADIKSKLKNKTYPLNPSLEITEIIQKLQTKKNKK